MIGIDENQYLLAITIGVLLASKERVIKKYKSFFHATSLCHYTGSLFLVGNHHYLQVWDYLRGEMLFDIDRCSYPIASIKRVLSTDNYIIKTKYKGVNLLAINDLKTEGNYSSPTERYTVTQ